MRFLLIGAGAVGIWLGANLVMARQSVTFVGRRSFVQAACAQGVHVALLGSETWRMHDLSVADSVASALQHATAAYDVVLLCVKAYALDQALAELREHAAPLHGAALITFQNGVGSEERAAAVFGPQRVIAGTLTSPISLHAPASIRLERAGGGVGLSPFQREPDESARRRFAAIATVLSHTPLLNVTTYADYRAMKWSKLLLNLMGNATSALLDQPVAAIYRDRALFAVEMQMLREAIAVIKAHDPPISIVNLPGHPARALARAVARLPNALLQPVLAWRVARGRGDKYPSLYYDVRKHTGKSEVFCLNGAVSEAGRRLGIATPVNTALTEMVMDAVRPDAAISPEPMRRCLAALVGVAADAP